ncbi:MAG: hypothetical protein V4525_13460 [Pseudomonadota bacterium]
MKTVTRAVLILTMVVASSSFAAPNVKSNNTRASLNQQQGGLLNKQVGTIGSVKGSNGTVSSNNTDVKLNQQQSGLLNTQEAHIGSITE